MSGLKVTLFGKFSIWRGKQRIQGMQARKVQELFSYLVIFRKTPQPREQISELLWGDQPPLKSRKNFRQTLWRLQSALKAAFKGVHNAPDDATLLVDPQWVQLNPRADFWLDTDEFEDTFNRVSAKRARDLSMSDFLAIQEAVNLYKGELLDGWYADWCIAERERFQAIHLMLLDKLVQFCEVQGHYDTGLVYGAELLRQDRAYERAHRQMMRLYFMAGDRTQAIHQYERCVTALRTELDIAPSERTRHLYEQIRTDTFSPPAFAREKSAAPQAVSTTLGDVLRRLEQFSEALTHMEFQVQEDIKTLGRSSPE